jgi:hypothetical protein
MDYSIDTVVNICAAMITASLIVLNYVILKGSFRQNRTSIELYQENLKISEETLKLNRDILEENRRVIERQELDNRPKFRIMEEGFRFDTISGKPHLYLENIGGKTAHVKTIHIVVIKNLTGVVKDIEMEKNIKPGAPLNIEIDLPVSVLEYVVSRKDGTPVNKGEIIFFSLNAVVEYTHLGDTDADVDPFVDIIGSKIGKDYFESEEYVYIHRTRRSTSKDTWYDLMGTGASTSEEEYSNYGPFR